MLATLPTLAPMTIIHHLMEMRLRLPEVLRAANLTPYAVAQRSNDRLDASTLYRLVRQEGRVKYFKAELCQALCETLGIKPADLFEVEEPPPKAGSKKRR